MITIVGQKKIVSLGHLPMVFLALSLIFTCLQHKSFENTVGKGEIVHNEQFLLFHSVLYPFGELSVIFIKFEIVVCKLFEFGRVQKLLFGKGLSVIFVRHSGSTVDDNVDPSYSNRQQISRAQDKRA